MLGWRRKPDSAPTLFGLLIERWRPRGLARAPGSREPSRLAASRPWRASIPGASPRNAGSRGIKAGRDGLSYRSRSDRSACRLFPSVHDPVAVIRTASWRLFGIASAAGGERGVRPSLCRS
jgi:hypothetical protein